MGGCLFTGPAGSQNSAKIVYPSAWVLVDIDLKTGDVAGVVGPFFSEFEADNFDRQRAQVRSFRRTHKTRIFSVTSPYDEMRKAVGL